MKTKHLNRAKLIFVLLPIMAVAFYTVSMMMGSNASSVFTPSEAVANISDMQPAPETGTPLDYTPMENMKFANWIIYNASYFQSVAQGTVKADLGFTKYTQNVKNTRKVKDKTVFSEAVSTSSLISVAEQKYITAKDVVLVRPNEKIKGESVVWSDNIYPMNTDTYFNKYGLVPREITKYAITEESVLSAKLLSFSDDEYVYEFTLKPEIAGKYFKNEIRTLAGASQDPAIKSMKATITMDDKWYVKTALCEDVYDIGIPVLGSMTCASTLAETFEYINEDRELEESALFEPFLPKDGDDIVDVETKEKSASDYLAAAFAPYINGEPLNLDIDVLAMGQNHDIRAKIDIATMHADVLVDDALYIGYKNDNVYIGAGNLNGYLPVRALSQIEGLGALGDVDLAGMVSDDVITALFADSDLSKADGIVTINMKFLLSDILKPDTALYELAKTIDLDVDLVINDGEAITLNRIDATVKVSGVPVLVGITPSDNLSFPDVSNFKSLEKVTGFVKPLLNTVKGQSFAVELNADIRSEAFSDTVTANVTLNRDLRFSADIRLVKTGVRVRIDYDGQTVYIASGNLKLKLNCGDVSQLGNKLADVFGEGFLPEITLPELPGVSVSDVLSTLNLKELLSHIEQFETVSDDTLRAAINYNGEIYGLYLSHNGQCISALDVDTLHVNGISVKLDARLNVSSQTASLSPAFPAADYADVNQLADFLAPLKQLIDANSYDFDLALYAGGAKVTGRMQLLRGENGVQAAAVLTAGGISVQVTFDGDTVFLQTGAVKLKLNLADTDELIALLKDALGANALDANALVEGIGAVANLQDALNSLTPDKLLREILVDLDVQDGALRLSLNLNGAYCKAELTQKNGAISAASLALNVNGEDIVIGVTVQSLNQIERIPAPEGNFSSLKDAAAFLRPVLNTVDKAAYSLAANVVINGVAMDAELIINRDLQSFSAVVTLPAFDVTANVIYKKGVVYLSALGFDLTASASDLPQLKSQLLPLLPENAREAAGALLDTLISLSGTNTDVSSLLKQMGLDVSLGDLADLDLAALLAKVERLEVTEGALHVTFDGINVTLTHDGALLTALTADGIRIKDVSLSAAVRLQAVSDENMFVAVPDKTFLKLGDLLPFVSPLLELTQNKAFTVDFNALLMPDTDNLVSTLNIPGQIRLLRKDTGLEFQINLQVPQSDGSVKEIVAAYENGNFYLIYGQTRIKFNDGDFDALSAMLSPYLPAFTPRLLSEIKAAVQAAMPETDLKAILNILNKVTMPESNVLQLQMDVFGLPATANLSLGADGKLGTLELFTSIDDVNYPDTRVHLGVTMHVSDMQADASASSLPAIAMDYTQAHDVTAYVGALLNTFTQEAYVVDFDDIEVHYADKTQKVAGFIEFLPSSGIPNLKGHIEVFEVAAGVDVATASPLHVIDIMITDGDPLQEIYLTYNGVKFKLTVEELTYLIGNVKDALNIKDGTLLDNIVPKDREKVSGKFLNDFNVSALTDMSDLINNALTLATKIYDEATAFMTDPDYDYHALGATLNDILDSLNSLLGNDEPMKKPSAYDVLDVLRNLPDLLIGYTATQDTGTMNIDVNGTVFELDRNLADNSYLTRWTMRNLVTPDSTADFALTMQCPDASQIQIGRPVYHDYNYASTSKGGKYKAQELIDKIVSNQIEGVSLPDYNIEYVEHDVSFTDADVLPSRRYKYSWFTYKQDNGGKYVKLENGSYIEMEDFIASIKSVDYVEYNGTYYTYKEFTDKKNLVHVNGSTQSFDSYYEQWFLSTYNMSYNDYYNLYLVGNQLNDLSNVSNLTTALLNTANLTDFHISGNLNVKIDIKVTTIKVDVPVDVRVKLIPVTLADGKVVNKPLVAVNISTPKYSFIVTVLNRSATQIYYWDGYLYFNKLQDGKYSYVRVSMEEFGAQAGDTTQLMKYIFYAAPLMGLAQDGINDAVAKGGDTTPGSFKDFYDYYYFKDNRHYAQIDLASLAGNTNLSDAEVFIGTGKLDVGNGEQTFMKELGFTTSMVGIVTMKFEAVLADIGSAVTSFRTPTGFNGDTPVYAENDIGTLIDYLTARTAYGTIDAPVTE